MLGAACDLSQNLQLGLTLDNLWGKLTWSAVAEELQYSLVADSVYAVDIQDDFYVLRDERVAIADYATELLLKSGWPLCGRIINTHFLPTMCRLSNIPLPPAR
jgi:hypothetical protein